MFAVIKTGGKQYIVSPDSKLKIEKVTPNEKGEVIFDEVLLMVDDDNTITMGNPTIKGAQIVGKLEKEGRDRKIIVFKYKAKKRYKKKAGHRQHYSEVLIKGIKTSGSPKSESRNSKQTINFKF
jgi:large subunit ribosomal protein L21